MKLVPHEHGAIREIWRTGQQFDCAIISLSMIQSNKIRGEGILEFDAMLLETPKPACSCLNMSRSENSDSEVVRLMLPPEDIF